MKRYIIISYEGANLSASEVMAIASQLNAVKPDVKDVHASTMDEEEVNSIIIRHVEAKNATELSVVESACIYVKKRFSKFFCRNTVRVTHSLTYTTRHNSDSIHKRFVVRLIGYSL